ncbi:hypothetical protein IOD16_08860 [Saccharothrix sp. 6-C]|uniref:hypothetical protein n=1 Tax=Saccharothrix sp. 6-C TaxID=2781735 RepID=UPI001917752A|nr:hypothetical protein [Saccharothrix sp. 6-C]QQQ78545.1 hypothetical protein IOD16_08860 [Saccharothrix sp. 6-C]
MPTDRTHPDACPGAVDVHQAADGGLARVRVPGGTLDAVRVDALRAAAVDLGDGFLELTSRANLQIRGLAPGAEHELGARLRDVGLLPSMSHERMRNIVAAPLDDNQALVDEIDAALLAAPDLASLPGRFLVTVGGAVSGLSGDIGLVGDALFLAGHDSGLRVTDPVGAVVTAARLFGQLRGDAWRLSEVDGGVRKITAALGVPGDARIEPGVTPVAPGEHGSAVVAGVPFGRWDARLLAGVPVRLTPWRSLVLPAGSDTTGLFTSPDSPWHGVSACTGRPGCAKSLADVRADAARWIGARTTPGRAHWSGCARRCGRPAGDVVEFVATGDGYEEIR